MPQRPISEEQFNQIANRVIATAPEGLSEEQFNALIDQEVAKFEAEHPHARVARMALDNLPAIGGMVGSLGGPPWAVVGGAAGALGRDLVRAGYGDVRTPRSAADAASNVVTEGGLQGALSVGGNLVGRGVGAAGRFITNRAVPLVRSALKQGFQAVQRRAGIEGAMASDVANDQAEFIVRHRLRKPEQAEALVKSLGAQIDDAAVEAERANPNLALDTAERIPRDLNALLRKVEDFTLPRSHRTAIQNVGRELVEDSPLSRSTYRPHAAETLEEGLARGAREGATAAGNVGRRARGQGEHQFTTAGGSHPRSSRPRELRDDIKPTEALRIIRSHSFYDPNVQGGQLAGGRTIESALRDSFKEAVPAARPLLHAQGRAKDATIALDRALWRDGSRDQVGMGGIAGLANGRPITAILLHLLKEGQLGAGIAADVVGPAITRGGRPLGFSAEQLARLVQAALTAEVQNPRAPRE